MPFSHKRVFPVHLVAYWLFLWVCLLQNPLILQIRLGNFYKGLYLVSFVILVLVIYLRGPVVSPREKMPYKSLVIFVLLTGIWVSLSAFLRSEYDSAGSILNVLVRTFQILLLIEVFRFISISRVFGFLYQFSVLVGFLALVFFGLNLLEQSSPFGSILVATDAGGSTLFYQFPFGFNNAEIPVNPLFFRAYSYFTEPASMALFQGVMLFYGLYFDRGKRRYLRRMIILLSICITLSLGGVFAFFLSWLSIKFIKTTKVGRLITVILVVFTSGAGMIYLQATDVKEYGVIAERRAMAFESRTTEWKETLSQIYQNPLGFGFEGAEVKNIQLRESGLEKIYKGPTNFLIIPYTHGLLYLGIYLIYIAIIFRLCKKLTSLDTLESRAVLSMTLMVLYFSLSYHFLDSVLLQIIIIFGFNIINNPNRSSSLQFKSPSAQGYL